MATDSAYCLKNHSLASLFLKSYSLNLLLNCTSPPYILQTSTACIADTWLVVGINTMVPYVPWGRMECASSPTDLEELFYNSIDVSLRGRVPDFPLVKLEGGISESEDLP